MLKLRHAYAASVLLFLLLLPAVGARAQVPPPVSYLFVEVKDTAGKAVSDATVARVDDGGKEYPEGKTDKDGVLRDTGGYYHGHAHVFSGLRVSKPGYIPSDHLVFYRPADGSVRYAFHHSDRVLYASEDLPGGAQDPPQDPQNWKPPPISVMLLKVPMTEAERRAVEAEERKRRLLAAVKKGDAATLRTLLAEGIGPNASDPKGVPAIAWAAFTGNRDVIFQLLDAGADAKNKKTQTHEALLIYLREGLWFDTNHRSHDAGGVVRREEVVRRLVEAGANVNAQSTYRSTALVSAVSQTPYSGQPAHSLSTGMIKYLIDKGANVNAAGRGGETALMAAALKGSDEITRMLVAAGANVNAKDKAGKTALIHAPQYHNSNPEVVKVLIAAGADVNAADNDGRTALMQAAFVGSAEIIRLLLGAKASVNARDGKGMTALMHAGTTHTTGGVARALIQAGAAVNERDAKGWTALMHAAPRYYNDSGAELVKVLIEAGADVNTADPDGRTPLMLASRGYDASVIRSLLAAGANINAKDKQGQTALMLAFQNITPTDVALFTSAGAAVNERDVKGWTALMYAASKHYAAEEMKALIDAGADVSAVNDEGQTPLMLAAQAGHAGAVRMLLENGMAGAVNARDKRGRTALMYVREGYSYAEPGAAVVRVLVSAGAEVNATDGEGQTALMYAAQARSTDAVKVLVEFGASVNAKDKRGRTALIWSVAAKRPYMEDVVQHLLQSGADAAAKDDEGRTALALAKTNGFEWTVIGPLAEAEARRQPRP